MLIFVWGKYYEKDGKIMMSVESSAPPFSVVKVQV